jgi:hypothetical protein
MQFTVLVAEPHAGAPGIVKLANPGLRVVEFDPKANAVSEGEVTPVVIG